MEELKKQHLEMLQLLESIEVMLQNGNSIHPNSVIRGAIQTAIGMEVDVTNVNDKCDNKQTAVEWLFEKVMITHPDNLDELLTQAKAMFKEQIIEAYYGQSYSTNVANGEQYYNETFKSE